MMADLKPGQLVRSLAGRDKDKHYIVLQVLDDKYVFLVDGRSRTLARPKRKNIAHLQRYDRGMNPGEPFEVEKLTDSDVISFLKSAAPDGGVPEQEV